MIKTLSELNLSEAQKAVFTKARGWAFECNMDREGITYEIEENILQFLNDNANINYNIERYFPDFYNSNDKIRVKGE